jgi:hypothetical protein
VIPHVGKLALNEKLIYSIFLYFHLVYNVTFGTNSLALQLGNTVDCHCESLQIFVQLVAESKPNHWTVTIVNVYLNIAVCVNIPLVS